MKGAPLPEPVVRQTAFAVHNVLNRKMPFQAADVQDVRQLVTCHRQSHESFQWLWLRLRGLLGSETF